MQAGIFRPVLEDATLYDTGTCAISGHEEAMRGTFSIHFADPEGMMRFGRIIVAEGIRLANERDEKIEEPQEIGETLARVIRENEDAP